MGRFLRRYGWRAYAIPVLVALTVLVVLQIGRRPTTGAAPAPQGAAVAVSATAITTGTRAPAMTDPADPAAPPVLPTTASPTSSADRSSTNPSGTTPSGTAPPVTGSPVTGSPVTGSPVTGSPGAPVVPVLPSGSAPGTAAAPLVAQGPAAAALPPGEAFVANGKGTWHLVRGTSAVLGTGGPKYTFTIEVEDGIQNAAADQDFASVVDAALADPRSWIGSGRFQLQRVDTGTPSFRISLTSQLTVRQNTLCGWEIHYEASCYARDVKRVAINDARWARGAVSFNGDRGSYRVYAINHEVGHALGFGHQPCATAGGLAPVMMQQSWSTANNDLSPLNPQLIPMDGKVCTFNPFPYPLGPLLGGGAPAGG